MIKRLIVEHGHDRSILTICKVTHLHNRYLIKRVSVSVINNPVVTNFFIAIIVINYIALDHSALSFFAGIHIHKYRTRRIIRQADDIKPGALEGKLRGRPSGSSVVPVGRHVAGHGHLLRAAHGEHGAAVVLRVVAVWVVISLTKGFEGLFRISSCIFLAVRVNRLPLRTRCRAAAVGKLRKAVLVVDVRGGDDVSGEQLRFVIIPFLTKLYIQRYGYVLVKRLIQCVQDVLTLGVIHNNIGRAIQSFVFEYYLFFPKRHCFYVCIIRYAKVAKLNLQRQAEIDNIRVLACERIVYPYILCIFKLAFFDFILGIAILRFKALQRGKVRRYSYSFVVAVCHRSVKQRPANIRILTVIKSYTGIKGCALVNGYVVFIERRFAALYCVMHRQAIRGLLCAQIIRYQQALILIYLNGFEERLATVFHIGHFVKLGAVGIGLSLGPRYFFSTTIIQFSWLSTLGNIVSMCIACRRNRYHVNLII